MTSLPAALAASLLAGALLVSDDRGGPAAGDQEGGDGTPAALDGFEPYPRSGDSGRRAAIERGL
ncbi:MAG: hypothetical protein VXZ39_14340, partial [Planctomycetota bacterium]|nr:hypothetical protein [Planctomycetota bacterium]